MRLQDVFKLIGPQKKKANRLDPNFVTRDQLRERFAKQGLQYDTPLIDAVAKGDFEKTKELITSGADPNQLGPMEGASPLGIVTSNVKMVELLLDHGANPNIRDCMDFTPLMTAAMSGHFDAIKLLIERGADPDAIAPPNWKAWMHACTKGHKDIAEYLKALSSDRDAPIEKT